VISAHETLKQWFSKNIQFIQYLPFGMISAYIISSLELYQSLNIAKSLNLNPSF
jgi:hypothetical protein